MFLAFCNFLSQVNYSVRAFKSHFVAYPQSFNHNLKELFSPSSTPKIQITTSSNRQNAIPTRKHDPSSGYGFGLPSTIGK
jgi:hypothetical protein